MPAGSSPQSRVVRYGCGRSFRGLGCCAATLVVTAMTAASSMRFISTPELSRAGVEAGGGNGLTGVPSVPSASSAWPGDPAILWHGPNSLVQEALQARAVVSLSRIEVAL